MNPSAELVSRLWRLCAILRKDGITYPQYVSELTYLLFLKMMQETKAESEQLSPDCRWETLESAPSQLKLEVYRRILDDLGSRSNPNKSIGKIFRGSATVIRDPKNVEMLVDALSNVTWFAAGRDSFGDLYEGLLQKNAEETKRGAGQYFTPRVIIEVIVHLLKPTAGDIIQDPAAGTGGFLIAAQRYIMKSSAKKLKTSAVITGMENVVDTYRLLLMNLYLHDISADAVHLGDTLSEEYKLMEAPSLILTNPPFGPAGGRPSRTDLTITGANATYQLPFVEHCVRALAPGGRAAIVIPDNVLFEEGRARILRELLLDECDLHTILRLPTGIFYAQGVKTNVLFFRRGDVGEKQLTKAVWIYDSRTNMPAYGRTKSLTHDDFAPFIRAYGQDPDGHAKRKDEGPNGRFRRFDREDVRLRGESLDISWLRESDDFSTDELAEPEELTAAIVGHLRAALAELQSIGDEVDMDTVSDLADVTID